MGCNTSNAGQPAAQPATQPAAATDKTLMTRTAEAKPDAAAKPKAPRSNVNAMLNEIFDRCDVNGDGNVSREELAGAFANLLKDSEKKTLVMQSGLNPYFNIFDQVDSDHDGKISREEFQEHLHPAKAARVIGQLLKEVFDRIDVNRDGNLSRKELEDAYGNLLNTTEDKSGKNWRNLLVDAGMNPDFYIFEQLDLNGDNKVTWEEFTFNLQPPPNLELFLRMTFAKLDANSDGSISKEELTNQLAQVLDLASPFAGKRTFRTMLEEAGINPDACNFEKLDTNHDGRITWEEFEFNLRPPNFKVCWGDVQFEGVPLSGQTKPIVSEALTKAPVEASVGISWPSFVALPEEPEKKVEVTQVTVYEVYLRAKKVAVYSVHQREGEKVYSTWNY